MEKRKYAGPIGEKIEEKFNCVAVACLSLDLIPPRTQTYSDALKEFVELIVYCNQNKLYHVRGRVLEKILKEF